MIVCHCTGATDRDVRKALTGGPHALDEMGRSCGAGRLCGGCVPLLERLAGARPAADTARPKPPCRRHVA